MTADPAWAARTVQAHANRLTQTANDLISLALAQDLAPSGTQTMNRPGLEVDPFGQVST